MFQPRITNGFLDDNLRSNYLELERARFSTHIRDFEGINSISSNQLRGLLKHLHFERRIFTQDRVKVEISSDLEDSQIYELLSNGVNGSRVTQVYRDQGPLLFLYKPDIRVFRSDICLN